MVRVALAGLLVLALAACTSVQGSLDGKLLVSVAGLPPGVEADVRVTGQGRSVEVKATRELELPEGEYTVEANPVRGPQGEIYAPSVTGSPARVEYGKRVEVSVVYQVQRETLPGALNVVVQGLPVGVQAQVVVEGPEGYSRVLTGSARLTGLKAGTYLVSARPVVVEDKTYQPVVDPPVVQVPGGGEATVNVRYTPPDTGFLAVQVSGLPEGARASVRVSAPGGRVWELTGTEVLELPVGAYVVTASEVVHGGTTYRPVVTGSPAQISKGSTVTVSVVYSPVYTTGALVVTVNGLPSGVEADVTVQGPGGFTRRLTGTTTLDGLAPGQYTVTARSVSTAGGVYNPRVAGSPAQVEAGATAGVLVEYTLDPSTAPGDLVVQVSGSPSGVPAMVRVQGPDGFDQTVQGTTVFTRLPAGYYTITAQDVIHGSRVYRASVTGSPARVGGGGTTTVLVSYALYTATLAVQIDGLPGPFAQVVVQGPGGYNRTLNASAVLTVEPGVYTVAAYPVTVDGVTYTPTVRGSPVSLDAGGNGAVRVSYEMAGP